MKKISLDKKSLTLSKSKITQLQTANFIGGNTNPTTDENFLTFLCQSEVTIVDNEDTTIGNPLTCGCPTGETDYCVDLTKDCAIGVGN